MNYIKYRFTLDMHAVQSQISIPVTLGDTARTLYVSLSDGGLPYIIENGCLAKIEIKRPTGTKLEDFCIIEKNTTIRYEFSQNENTAAVEGIHECNIVIYDTDGNKICTPRFTMVVSDRVFSADDLILTDEDKRIVEAIVAAEVPRQNAEIERIAAESARQNAEAQRAEAEEQRALVELERAKLYERYLENAPLPIVSAKDEGKILKVTNGKWAPGAGSVGKHEHDVSDFVSGILSIERGGTGASTVEEALQNLGIADFVSSLGYAKTESGYYNGTGSSSSPVTLTFSFVPKIIIIIGNLVYSSNTNNVLGICFPEKKINLQIYLIPDEDYRTAVDIGKATINDTSVSIYGSIFNKKSLAGSSNAPVAYEASGYGYWYYAFG